MNKWTDFSQYNYVFLQLGIRLGIHAVLVFIVHPPFNVCKGLVFIFFLKYAHLSGTTGLNSYMF